MSRNILVCGGAGYIGSHMVRMLRSEGHAVTVFDNFCEGHRAALPEDVTVIEGDLCAAEDLARAFAAGPFHAVYHFAALISVGESVGAPDLYYRNNVAGALNLLDAMRAAGCDRIVFSSTAAIFGNPETDLIDESHRHAPLNPYGWSKLMTEQVLADHAAAYGIRSVSFRYFNAAGADPDGRIGEAHDPETHLIPNILLAALGARPGLDVFGDDYDTKDGTCVRDYVHVNDIASAHLAALDFMDAEDGAHAFNLGNGRGFTILEVIEAARAITGRDVPVRFKERRPGDAAMLVADSTKARERLGWKPRHPDISDIISTAWRWHQAPAYGPFATDKRRTGGPND